MSPVPSSREAGSLECTSRYQREARWVFQHAARFILVGECVARHQIRCSSLVVWLFFSSRDLLGRYAPQTRSSDTVPQLPSLVLPLRKPCQRGNSQDSQGATRGPLPKQKELKHMNNFNATPPASACGDQRGAGGRGSKLSHCT